MNQALLLCILQTATSGPECYRPKDRRVPTLREFQLFVETARQAQADGLIEASFQLPSKGKITQGLVRTFTVSAITGRGLQFLHGELHEGLGSQSALARLRALEGRSLSG